MESTRTKIAVFVLIVLTLGLCLGMALMKFNEGVNSSTDFSNLPPEQKLQQLEKSTLNTERTRNLIEKSRVRTEDTKAAEDAAYGGQ